MSGRTHDILISGFTLSQLEADLAAVTAERERYRATLERIAGCDWVITLPDRMDAVRKIAQDALNGEGEQ
jgi:hypothetical protein